MKTVSFYDNNRNGDILHIETEGCVVNIHINLYDSNGKRTTRIDIIPDNCASDKWTMEEGSRGNLIKKVVNYDSEGIQI